MTQNVWEQVWHLEMTDGVGYFNNFAGRQSNICVFTGDVLELVAKRGTVHTLSRITPVAFTEPHLPPNTGGPWKGLSHIATHNHLLAQADRWPGDNPSKWAECSKDNRGM